MIECETLNELARRLYAARKQDARSGGFEPSISNQSLSPTEEEVVSDIMSHNLEYIGHGAARITFRSGDHIVKFARGSEGSIVLDGREQNSSEVSLWQSTEHDLLNPILDSGVDNLWVKCPPLTPIMESELPELQRKKAIGHVQTEAYDIDGLGAMEISADNIGFDGEDVYILDYGLPEAEE